MGDLDRIRLFLIGDGLRPQELFNPPVAVEATKPTCLSSAMWKRPFVVDGHGVDVYSTVPR